VKNQTSILKKKDESKDKEEPLSKEDHEGPPPPPLSLASSIFSLGSSSEKPEASNPDDLKRQKSEIDLSQWLPDAAHEFNVTPLHKKRLEVLRRLRIQPGQHETKRGWMQKQGHIRPNWTRRFFVLQAGKLEYYSKEIFEVHRILFEFFRLHEIWHSSISKGFFGKDQCH